MSKDSSSPRVARGAAIASLAVMGSRLMGLVREQLFAFFFGASREYDAFLTAFRIPNLLRDLFAEGALSSAFVATFSKRLEKDGKEPAFALANSVANALVLFLSVIVLIGFLYADNLVHAMAVGFDPEKALLATRLTRLLLPFIVCVALAAVAMGMLNAQDFYALPQSASTFFNITSIVVGLSTAFVMAPDYMKDLWLNHASHGGANSAGAERAMVGMAIGVLAGGLVQWLIQMPKLYSTGYRWRPMLDFQDPHFRTVVRLMAPSVIGASAVQLNVFVNSNFASMLGDKPISWLNYAFRLMQFPLGVFGVAVMTATLPALARRLAANDRSGFGKTLTEALELVLFLTLPAAVGLAVLGEPIIRLIYEHGRFATADTVATAAALGAYAFGLPGYSALKIIQPAFVTLDDAKTPMYVGLGAVGLNVALNFIFVRVLGLGHVGLAASTALLATFNVALLVWLLEQRQPSLQRRRLLVQVLKIIGACTVMGGVGHVGYVALQDRGWSHGFWYAGLEIALLLPVCVGIYLVMARLLHIETMTQALGMMQRKLGVKRS